MKLKHLLPFAKPSQLLVCETDGFSLRAAVLRRVDDEMELVCQARTEQVDMAEGLADVIAVLKAEGWEGGGSAILLSPAVFSTLVELPANPKKPRPLPQMLELVRWEAEPLLLQHMTRWSVGHLLVGQGYMTEDQAQAVMDMQQGKTNASSTLAIAEQFSLRRFGDLAVELGYIKRSQLNACLTGQEWLKADDEIIECGWTAQGPVEDIPGTFNWLIGCVHQSLLQRWAAAFAKYGVKLRAMYPLTGCAPALLPDGERNAVILETQTGLGFSSRLIDGRSSLIQHYQNLHMSELDICLESYHALHAPPRDPVWLACWPPAADLPDEFAQMLELEVRQLSHPLVGAIVSPGMAGAASQTLGLADEQCCVGVRVGGPLPPVRDRLEVRAAALLLLLLALAGISELSLWLRYSSMERYKARVDASWQSIDAAAQRINAQIAAIEERKQKIKALRAEQKRIEALTRFYDEEIPERMGLVKGVLGMLQTVVDDEVVIERLDERGKHIPKPVPNAPAAPAKPDDKTVEAANLVLEAWALNETAAQTFVQRVSNIVRGWNLQVRDPKVAFGKGPLSANGFNVSMRLVKLAGPDGKIIRQSETEQHETALFK
jgi:hypothetical protein